MFELDYYTVEELAAKLESILSKPVTAKEIIHQSIKGKTPIYIAPKSIASCNEGESGSYAKVERGTMELGTDNSPNYMISYQGRANDLERLSQHTLKDLDKKNICNTSEPIDVYGLWAEKDHYACIELHFYGSDSTRGIPTTLSDLYVLADDAQALEAECKAQLDISHNQIKKADLSESKEQTYLAIIAVLLEKTLSNSDKPKTQGSIANEIEDEYGRPNNGLSHSQLTKIFPKAKEALNEKLK